MAFPGEEKGVELLRYDGSSFMTTRVPLDKIGLHMGAGMNSWVRVKGSLDEGNLRAVAALAGLDDLDINTILLQSEGSPKLLQFSRSIFLTWQFIEVGAGEHAEKKIHLLIGDGFLVSFEDQAGALDGVLELFIKGTQIRKMPVSYLLYSVLDSTVDDLFEYSKDLGKQLDKLQGAIETRSGEVLDDVLGIQDELSSLWMTVWPLKDITNALHQRRSTLIAEPSRVYFEDINNRINGLMALLQNSRQEVPQVIGLYENHVANQLNRIVRILTVITVVFTPITFIASWYGMNFEHMPSLDEPLAYPAVIVLTAAIGLGLWTFFWKKGWIKL